MKKQLKPTGKFAGAMKKMEGGGYPDPNVDPNKPSWLQGANAWGNKNADTLGTGAAYAGATINAIDPKDKYGVQSNVGATASGALNGAAAGFKTAGVIGAGVGLIAGGVSGLLGNKAANKKKTETIAKNTTAQLQQTEAMGESNIAADPSLKYGRMSASYYRFGGVMKGTSPTPPRTIKPIAAVQAKPRLMPDIAEVPGRQISRLANGGSVPEYNLQKFKRFKPIKMADGGDIEEQPPVRKGFQQWRASLPKNLQGSSDYDLQGYYNKYGSKGPAANGHLTDEFKKPNHVTFSNESIYSNPQHTGGQWSQQNGQWQFTPSQYNIKNVGPDSLKNYFKQNEPDSKLIMKKNGGTIEPLSSEDVKINGPSHAAGGVKFPSQGVELEGGETVNDNFVFSKKLGFAKPAEKIARALGKAEQRPDSPLNNTTVAALKRKTEGLKAQQESTKAALGIPNEFEQKDVGGPVKPGSPSKLRIPTTRIDFGNLRTPGILSASDTDFLNKNAGWLGAPNGTQALPGGGIVTNLMASSDKANGTSNAYYPARNQARGKSIPTQPHSTFKFGGKMKQVKNTGGAFTDNTGQQIYANGGLYDDPEDLTGVTITGKRPIKAISPAPVFPGTTLDTPATLPGINLTPDIPPGTTPQTSSNSNGKFNIGNTLTNIADKAAPFLSNYINATQKLPLPPVPITNSEISPSLVDYSASRNEAVRATRSADSIARKNLNTGAAVVATKAANLAGQQRSIAQINEAENSTNAGIRNQTAAQNAQIRAGNTVMQNNYNNELVSRTIKGQQLKSQNFANIEEKIQGMSQDKKLFDLEDQKAMLGWLQNNDSGAGYDAVRNIFAKHLSSDSLKQMDDQVAKQRKERAEDRAETVKMGKLQLDYLKRKGISPTNPYDLVGNGISVVNSAKDEQADSKTRIKKKE